MLLAIAAFAEVLKLAAERADCELHASIVHIEEEGSGRHTDTGCFDEWGRRDDDTDDVEMDGVFEGRYWARRQVERGAVEAGNLIARLISVWPAERSGRNGDVRAAMLRLLGRIDDATLAMRLLREVLLLHRSA